MDFESSLNFVGRRAELALWTEYLANPQGQAVLIVGAEGTGKSALIDQIVLQTWYDPKFRCGYVQYDVGSDSSPESIMRYMLEDAFYSARAAAGAVDMPGLRFWQWDTLFDGIGIGRRQMEEINHLVDFLRFDPQKNIAEQFLGRLQKITSSMAPEGRVLFLVDYWEKIPDEFVTPWIPVIKNLPQGAKFVFSQRINDAFLRNSELMSLPQVKTIPASAENGLGPLAFEDFDGLLTRFSLPLDRESLKHLHQCYAGNPYMLRTVFDLVRTNPALTMDSFPNEPDANKLAQLQWKQVESLGPEVVRLFRAYAFLDVTVPDEIAMQVAGIDLKTFKKTLDIPYVRRLIRSRPDGHQIADRPLSQCIAGDSRTAPPFGDPTDYHRRAISAFESRLQRSLRTDVFAATRIPEHALIIGGPYAFARAACDVVEHLLSLSHFDTALNLIEQALEKIDPQEKEAGQLRYKTGSVWLQRGDKEKAKAIFNEAIGILRNADDSDTLPDVLLAQSSIAMDEGRWADAYRILEEASKNYAFNEDQQGLVDASILLGKVLWKLGRQPKGEKVFQEVLEMTLRIEYNRQRLRSQASVYCTWGKLYEEQGEYEKATEQFNKALDLTQNIYDRVSEALIYANLRVFQEVTGKLKKAEEYELKSLEIHKELGNLEAMAVNHTNLAYLAEKMGNMNKKRDHLEQAKKLYLQFGEQEKAEAILK